MVGKHEPAVDEKFEYTQQDVVTDLVGVTGHAKWMFGHAFLIISQIFSGISYQEK